MEITCNRCHRTVLDEDCYCPACGLPQLLYNTEDSSEQAQLEQRNEIAVNSAIINWKLALRKVLMLAIPAGLLSSSISHLGFFGLLWVSAAATWAVILYARSQRQTGIRIAAGARIGLVTGLFAAWLAFSISGSALFVERVVLHHSSQIDAEWKDRVQASQEMTRQWSSGMGTADATQAQAVRAQLEAFMLSPEGHAGMEALGFACNAVFLLLFAVAGGALGARLLLRNSRPGT